MSYWSKDWICSDCNCKALSTNKKCPNCGNPRPFPRACEAGPLDVTQELIEVSRKIGHCNFTWKYFPDKDAYGIDLSEKTTTPTTAQKQLPLPIIVPAKDGVIIADVIHIKTATLVDQDQNSNDIHKVFFPTINGPEEINDSLDIIELIKCTLTINGNTCYLYHGFPGDNAIGLFISSLGKLEFTEHINLEDVQTSDEKAFFKWYLDITKNCMDFGDLQALYMKKRRLAESNIMRCSK